MRTMSLPAFAVACLALLGLAGGAKAAPVFAVDVNGTFAGDPADALGESDGAFVQLVDSTDVTLDLGGLVSTPGTLSIFTIDDVGPDTVIVEVSADGADFLTLGLASDANGTPPDGSRPRADFEVSEPFRYVRLTDLPGQPGDGLTPDRGFDLDAVGFDAVSAAPAPAGLPLAAVALAALAGYRWRRSAATP